MSWLFVIVAIALLSIGLTLRIWMRGADNYTRASRVAANAILAFAVVVGVYAIPAVRGALDWYYFVLLIIVVMAYFASSLLRRNPVVDRPKNFKKKTKARRRSMSKDKLANYHLAHADYRRELRKYRFAKVPWFIALTAAIVAIIVLVNRFLTDAALEFDPSYSPIHWGVLIAVASVVAGSILMRWPLGVCRPWNTVPLAVAAVVILAMTAIPAIVAFQAAANVIYQTPAEEGETTKAQPSVDILTEVDKTCPPGYAVPSKMENGGPVLSQSGIEEIDESATPDESASAANPNLLLEKVRQKIDDATFVQSLEEGIRTEFILRGESFSQVDFDSLLAGLKVADATDLTVPYGNVLCITPEGQAAHAALYGW